MKTPAPSVWRSVLKLQRLQWVLLVSRWRRAGWGRKIVYIVTTLGGLAVLVGIMVASGLLLRFLNSPELQEMVDVELFFGQLPALLFTAAFVGLLLTSFGALLQTLYLSGDLEFLLNAPLPARAIFVAKMVQAILPTLTFIGFFGLPLLFGLGYGMRYTWLYYPLAVVLFVAVSLAATGIAALLVMGIVRIFPARRVGEVLLLITTLFFTFFGQMGGRFGDISSEQSLEVLHTATRLTPAWSPLSWPGVGLIALGEGRWLPGLALSGLVLACSGGIFYAALITAEALYFSGWANVQVSLPRRARREQPQPGVARRAETLALGLRRLFSPPVWAILVKDLRLLRRDLHNLSQVLSSLVFGIIYLIATFTQGGDLSTGSGEIPGVTAASGPAIVAHVGIGIALFVGWSLLSRLAMMGFSQEGNAYWILKTAPVRGGRLLFAKFLVAYLPTYALSTLFLIAAALFQRMSLLLFVYGLAALAFVLAGAAGVNLTFGVLGANLEWEDPRQMVRGGVGCLGSLVGMLYMGLSMGAFLAPPLLFIIFDLNIALGYSVGLVAGMLISLSCAIIPLWAVRSRVARIGER